MATELRQSINLVGESEVEDSRCLSTLLKALDSDGGAISHLFFRDDSLAAFSDLFDG